MDPHSFALALLASVIIVAIVIGGPLFIAWQFIKSRAARTMSKDDAALIAKIAGIADRMDRRMAVVEQILEHDAPAGHRDNATIGGEYGRKIG
jgi:phage shock protein B